MNERYLNWMNTLPEKDRKALYGAKNLHRIIDGWLEKLEELEDLKRKLNELTGDREYKAQYNTSVASVDVRTKEIIKKYQTISEASRDVGRSVTSIVSALKGLSITCAGTHWVVIEKHLKCRRCKKLMKFESNFRHGENSKSNRSVCMKCEKHLNKAIRARVYARKKYGEEYANPVYEYVMKTSPIIKYRKTNELVDVLCTPLDRELKLNKLNELVDKEIKRLPKFVT